MGYYMRAFCTAAEVPPLHAVLAWVAEQGVVLQVDLPAGEMTADLPMWDEAELSYKAERQPIECSVARDEGTPDCLFREEIRELEEFLEDAGDTPVKERVLEHLRQSRYVVANQLLSDVDDEGYRASALILEYFVQHAGGLIQADAEGFYEGDSLILPLT